MTLKESNQIYSEATEQAEDQPPKLILKLNSNLSIEVTGAILEAQYTDGNRHILFVTEDIPFEETLHIYLLNSNLEPIDNLSLSAIYSPGILKDLSITQPNKISFSFFNAQEKWQLEIFDRPTTLLWGNKHPVKRIRPLLHKTWLSLRRTNRADGSVKTV